MRILLDACVPLPLWRFLRHHSVEHANRCGWREVKNGELLALAEAEFSLFITSDQNLSYQQNLTGRRLAILALWTNDWNALKARGEDIARAADAMLPGGFLELH